MSRACEKVCRPQSLMEISETDAKTDRSHTRQQKYEMTGCPLHSFTVLRVFSDEQYLNTIVFKNIYVFKNVF